MREVLMLLNAADCIEKREKNNSLYHHFHFPFIKTCGCKLFPNSQVFLVFQQNSCVIILPAICALNKHFHFQCMGNIKIETIAAVVGNGRGNHLNLPRILFTK
jgi:hypothetical protein